MNTTFNINVAGHDITVSGDEKGYKKALAGRKYKIFTFVIVDIKPEAAMDLCRRSNHRGVGKYGWYAQSHKDGYVYRKESYREGVRVIDICTYGDGNQVLQRQASEPCQHQR